MSDEFAIRVSNLSKMYRMYNSPAAVFWEVVTRKPKHKEFWALKDISFEVRRGQVVGIIGRNGAGKSTLLRILAGTLDHTEGTVEINGKISAILELGTGFHPEYTGRQNVYMGGMCLGMSRKQVGDKLDWIIDFSELRDVIDQPFKTYSTGMKGRLTFATAVSVDPDIFIVDEALATGDMLFSEKCFRRIREIVDSGATVFFVTHGLTTVYELCDTCMLLSEGDLVAMGEPRTVGYEYERILAEARQASLAGTARPQVTVHPIEAAAEQPPAEPEPGQVGQDEPQNDQQPPPAEAGGAQTPADAPRESSQGESCCRGDGAVQPVPDAEILACEIRNLKDIPVLTLVYGESYVIRMLARCSAALDNIRISYQIRQVTGRVICGGDTAAKGVTVAGGPGEIICVEFDFPCSLQSGNYLLSAGVDQVVSGAGPASLALSPGEVVFDVYSRVLFPGVAQMSSEVVEITRRPDPDAVAGDGREEAGHKAEILGYEILDEQLRRVESLDHGRTYTIRLMARCHRDIGNVSMTYRIEHPSGMVVAGVQSFVKGMRIEAHAGEILCVDFSFPCMLQKGSYILGGGIAEVFSDTRFTILHLVRGAVQFSIRSETDFPGVVNLPYEVKAVTRCAGLPETAEA